MTDKEIRVLARERLAENTDIVVISIVYYFSVITMIHMIESFITSVIRMFEDPSYSFFSSMGDLPKPGLFLVVLRLTLYFCIITVIENVLLRYFINMNSGGQAELFTSLHWRRLIRPCLNGSIFLLLYKILVSLPLLVSVHGVMYFRNKSISDTLTLTDLVLFMLCIGFSLVWIGALLHYFISLSLVPYIYAINPRVNFFDACDLSVKLMDGKHLRVIIFWLRILPYMLPAVFVYPLLLIYPYIMEVKLIFSKEIIGSYWQDKIPAMARRWERQQARLKRSL